MSDLATRTAQYDELLRRFASGVRAAQLYAPDHPLVGRNTDGLLAALSILHQQAPSIVVGVVDGQLVVADTPMPKASAGMGELIKRLTDFEIERVSFERGLTSTEAASFMKDLSGLTSREAAEELKSRFPHIKIGRITTDEHRSDGLAGDMAAIRQLYTNAVAAAEMVWESATVEGKPDIPAALQAVNGLSEAVTQNRTALMALTAMRSYDNYTFTHMVNVSILTMGQARALGIEGRLLREFGLSGLMHDIGKVRTPKEILNKTEALTDGEFTIMRRHTVDGAELLRRTPEIPALAPVVAFEHHLRMDGTGYPFGVARDRLNLATVLCSIADVYDAMRMQRTYQQAFPTDRILAVLKQKEGKQFDQNLVRRFVQLLGVYPPGNLVRLDSGEIAVVVHVHAPDPYRPRVRVLVNRERVRLAIPYDRSLWEPRPDGTLGSVAAPVDPSDTASIPLHTCRADERCGYTSEVSEGLRTIALAFAALGAGFTWQSFRTTAIPASAPDRLVAELRLSQVAAMLLALVAGMSLGIAGAHEQVPGVALDVALAVGFFVCATAMLVRDPRQALTVLAIAFAFHAVFDIAHRPGSPLPDGLVPRWFTVGGAVYDVCIGALCYLPMLRR